MTISNEQGRAMEYVIVKEIEKSIKQLKINFSYSTRAEKDNLRDKGHFDNISETLQKDFVRCGLAAVSWIEKQGWFKDAIRVNIDRLPDSEGVRSVVSDIRLRINYESGLESSKEISLKHNHDALKHPRLPRLPEQCGISDLKLKRDYMGKRSKIWDDFFHKARSLKSDSTKFSEVKAIKNDVIEQELYKPLITLVNDFLVTNANNSTNASTFFKFLTSTINFYAIKNEQDRILVKHFIDIKQPNSFSIQYPYKNRLTTCLIKFDNGWDVTMRLHTASSEFYRNAKINASTKFDVICININSVIKIESVPKPKL